MTTLTWTFHNVVSSHPILHEAIGIPAFGIANCEIEYYNRCSHQSSCREHQPNRCEKSRWSTQTSSQRLVGSPFFLHRELSLTRSRFPFKIGYDASGVVTEIGQGVSRFKVGDAVYVRLPEINRGTDQAEGRTNCHRR